MFFFKYFFIFNVNHFFIWRTPDGIACTYPSLGIPGVELLYLVQVLHLAQEVYRVPVSNLGSLENDLTFRPKVQHYVHHQVSVRLHVLTDEGYTQVFSKQSLIQYGIDTIGFYRALSNLS